LPAHTQLKHRYQGQTSEAEVAHRDLQAELLRKEAEHRRKTGKAGAIVEASGDDEDRGVKRLLENGNEDEETAKRRKILEETRDIDAESEEDDSDRYTLHR
jgi:protein CWC15